MKNSTYKTTLLREKQSLWAFLFIALVFVGVIAALFSHEKQRQAAEIERIVLGSPNIQIQHSADNGYRPERGGNLLHDLSKYGFTQAEIDEATAALNNQEQGSSMFRRKGDYMSWTPLNYNGWRVVSTVHGSDVLLGSAAFFREVVAISPAAILLTVGAVYIIFLNLRSSRRNLQEEQERNHAYMQQFQSMFEQHTAPQVVIDAATGEIVDANPAMLHYFEYTREQIIGRNMKELNMLPHDIQDRRMQEELNGRLLYHSAPHRLKSGETRLLDIHASVILGNGRRLLYAILTDVTDRERYRVELWREKEMLRATMQSIGDGVITTDNLGVITGMNSAAEKLTGWDRKLAVGSSLADVFILKNEETGYAAETLVQKILEAGTVRGLSNQIELVNRNGNCISISNSAAPIKTEDGKTFGFVMVFRDVSYEKECISQIEFFSYRDFLTNLYNRRYIEETILRLDAEETLPVSVIVADVNGLKVTNDVFGHEAGDALLVSVANLMRKSCQETNLIARWGGDEFVILMPGRTLEDAESVIRRIKNAHIALEENSLPLSLSLGCACRGNSKFGIRAALQQAEKNMYQQKLLDGKSYRSAVISTLLATLREKSDETEEHSKRLETYCHAIGQKLRLSSREMDELSLLALLHDIGKVNIHPDILRKPGPLTLEEWSEMRRHPEIGYHIARTTPELAAIANLILSHHERWDGTGYPRQLEGEEIPLACRILSVVDAYDAMTRNRVYRKAMTVDEAIQEIKRNEGTQFDPYIAGLFVEIIERFEINHQPLERHLGAIEVPRSASNVTVLV